MATPAATKQRIHPKQPATLLLEGFLPSEIVFIKKVENFILLDKVFAI